MLLQYFKTYETLYFKWIFGPMRDEVRGQLRKLRTEELYDLYSQPNIVQVVNSRIMRWAGHAGERRGTYRVLV
jgi:hypothetical protein